MNLPTGLTGYALLGLGLALAASLAANGVVGHLYLSTRDELATANQRAVQSASQAKQCSEGVESLRAAAESRAQRAEGAREAAMALARTAQAKGFDLLSKPPAVPGDDCASARVQADDWLSGRGAK